MQGMSERQYAAHVGLSRGAIQKAKAAERLVLYPDGSINAAATTPDVRDDGPVEDPQAARTEAEAVPEAAVAAVGDTLREQGLAVPAVGGGTTSCRPRPRTRSEGAGTPHPAPEAEGGLIERARALSLCSGWRGRCGMLG